MENITTSYDQTPDIINILRAENNKLKKENFFLGNTLEVKERKIQSLESTLTIMDKLADDLSKENQEQFEEIHKLKKDIQILQLDSELHSYHKKRK